MALENLIGKIRRGALATGLGAIMAVSYGCIGDEKKEEKKCVEYVVPNSLYGWYNMEWTKTEDTHGALTSNEGTYEMELLTLGSDARVRVTVFDVHDFDRNAETGWIEDTWEDEVWGGQYELRGNVNYDEMALEASAEFDWYDGERARVAIDLDGTRKIEE